MSFPRFIKIFSECTRNLKGAKIKRERDRERMKERTNMTRGRRCTAEGGREGHRDTDKETECVCER